MPKGSVERKDLLNLVATEIEFAGTATPDQQDRFAAEFNKIVKGAGRLLFLRLDDPTKSNGWQAVFDTEFAALRVYYTYRLSRGVKLGRALNMGGWYVSMI